MGYLVPDSVDQEDSAFVWTNLANAGDGDWDTYAYCQLPGYTFPPDMARIKWTYNEGHIPDVVKIQCGDSITVLGWNLYGYWSSEWHCLASDIGEPPNGEYAVGSGGSPVTGYRLEVYTSYPDSSGGHFACYELAAHVADESPVPVMADHYRRLRN